MESNRPIQMVLASSSKLFLEGIRSIIEDEGDIKIVAEASDPEEIEKYLIEIKPKFLFLDNRTLDLDIRKLLNLIAKKSPDTKVMLFGDQIEDEPTFPNVLYITKETNSLELVHTIKKPDSKIIPTKEVTYANSAKCNLTKTEVKVVELIVGGFSNKEIAKRLSISEKTVKAHLTNIFMKLNLQNRYQLIVYARKLKRKVK